MSNVLSAFCAFQMLVLSRNIRHNFAALSSSLLRALGRQDQPSKYSAAVGCSAAHFESIRIICGSAESITYVVS